jgi:hypothetical protein
VLKGAQRAFAKDIVAFPADVAAFDGSAAFIVRQYCACINALVLLGLAMHPVNFRQATKRVCEWGPQNMKHHTLAIPSVTGMARSLVSLAFDRRIWQRLTVHLPVTLILPNEASFPHPARLRNLSPGGARLSMLSRVKIGTPAVLEHANSRMRKACIVRFCRRELDGFAIGLEFETPLSSAEFETTCLILRN